MAERCSITVLMLCWNHARFLPQAIAALVEQTDQAFDVIFLDNASSDGSAELAARCFAAHGLDATILINDAPRGISANLNKLLEHATSEIVCVISADDWYHPHYVEEVHKASTDYPCGAVFYPKAFLYDDERKRISDRPEGEFLSGNLWEHTRKLEWKFGVVGLAYRRSALVEVGGWDERMIAEDNDMFFRLSEHHVFIHIPKRLFYYRISPSSISANYVFVMNSWYQFFDKHRGYFPNKDRLLFSYGKSHLVFALKKRKYAEALRLAGPMMGSLVRTLARSTKASTADRR